MTLSDISIRRPVFAWMLMIGLIVFGTISFLRMGISQLPDVDFPVLTVSVNWVGASPETMELAVADVIENAVMSIEGIRSVTSNCQEGSSSTSIEFELSRNIDVAVQEVQTKIAQAQRNLPTDIDPPTVTKSNPEDQPIMWVTLSGPNTLREKTLFVRDRLKDMITTVSGVGDVRLGGYVDPNMRIWLNVNEMRKREIAVDDVTSALITGNILSPSGFMNDGPKETNIRVMGETTSADAVRDLVIPARSGAPIWRPIRIGELGKVEEGLADIRRISRSNSEPAVGLGILKQRGSNAVSVGSAVKLKIKQLKDLLPGGMKLTTVVDTTKFIEDSTKELLFTLGLSALLTSVVCYLFLGSWSSAFNVILAIPTSLIGAFIALYFLGFTINSFTLLALSLSIGIVVDDAIMVLENIVRHHESGMSRVKAALVGAREITGAATAASLAILAIFVPVVFMKGVIGKFFYQFGIAMSVAVALSLLEALTLAPMRCSQFLSTAKQGDMGLLGRNMDRLLSWMANTYRRILAVCLNHRWKIVIASCALFGGSLFLLGDVRKEFVPPQDQSRFLVTLQMPLGSSLEATDAAFREAEKLMKARPEVDGFFVAIGGFQGGLVNSGNMFVNLKDPKNRPIVEPFKTRPTQQEFMGVARSLLAKIPGVKRATVMDLSLAGFTSSRGFPVTFSIQGPHWEKIAEYSKSMMDKMNGSGLMTDVDTDYKPNMPEVRVVPDRVKAAARGVTIQKIADTISALMGSLRVGRYTDSSGHRDDIRVKLLDEFNRRPDDIGRIWVRNNHGEMVQLSEVVTLKEQPTLLTISRYNRERAVSIFANVTPGKSQAQAMEFIDKTAKEILPTDYHVVLSGNSQAFKESFQSLILALVLGIFVAYMVLGAQFNSFLQPVTILLALPFSVTGAFIAMRLSGISLNIYSMIGLLLLMGIVKKNSILLVDFTNHQRVAGKAVKDALLHACPLRLRPILMTSVATVTAAVPAAFALGPGAETTRPMAIVVIGGVILSTVLTLIVVPCAYSLLSRLEGTKHQKELKEALASLKQDELSQPL
ncbi:efflux RND transporter permease subunit [Bdellovibrionota bacterium FG-2]